MLEETDVFLLHAGIFSRHSSFLLQIQNYRLDVSACGCVALNGKLSRVYSVFTQFDRLHQPIDPEDKL